MVNRVVDNMIHPCICKCNTLTLPCNTESASVNLFSSSLFSTSSCEFILNNSTKWSQSTVQATKETASNSWQIVYKLNRIHVTDLSKNILHRRFVGDSNAAWCGKKRQGGQTRGQITDSPAEASTIFYMEAGEGTAWHCRTGHAHTCNSKILKAEKLAIFNYLWDNGFENFEFKNDSVRHSCH